MNKIIKNTGILMAITLVAGALLGLVYEVTKTPIAQAQEDAKQEAYRTVLADADTFVNEEGFKESKAQKILKKAGYDSDDISEVVGIPFHYRLSCFVFPSTSVFAAV